MTEYVTAEQLAEALKVSEKSIFRWASQDPTMPALRIGRTLRFPKERLERWLADREQGRARRSRTPSPLALQPRTQRGNPRARPQVLP